LDASDENCITVTEWWQLYSKAACKGNVQQPMDEVHGSEWLLGEDLV
jgi:hypothetical protein